MDYFFQDVGKTKKVGRPKGSKNDKKTKTSSETKTSKKPKSKTDIKSKKGGNFLGSVGELVAPTGWEGFAIDRADTALRRFKKRMSGGHWRTRKQIFYKDMKKLNIEYDVTDQKWKKNGEVVIDSSMEKISNFPPLHIVINSLSKFFEIPLKHKNGKPFMTILNNKVKLDKLKEIYDQIITDIIMKISL